LHVHTGSNLKGVQKPEEVIENKKGSNCGFIPLEILAQYHNNKMKNQFMAITEHSRDADPEVAVEVIEKWFLNMRLNDAEWLQDNIGKKKDEIIDKDIEQIKELIKDDVEKVALYGDERLEDINNRIDNLVDQKPPIKILKGIEANLKLDGSFDTSMIEKSKFELVNCSIYPNLDKEAFNSIINDPNKYTDLVIRGLENPQTNIIAHIGYGCDQDIVENLNWDKIAETAIKNKVAIEINLKELTRYINNEILDYDKYPKNQTDWREDFKQKLPELIPIVSSSAISQKLKKYF